jgi:hypothetical protein
MGQADSRAFGEFSFYRTSSSGSEQVCAAFAFASTSGTLLRRNKLTFPRLNLSMLGVSAWGITMTDSESGKERRYQVERYRLLAQEITDPLAAGLLREIVSELEAELNEVAEDAIWSPQRRPA